MQYRSFGHFISSRMQSLYSSQSAGPECAMSASDKAEIQGDCLNAEQLHEDFDAIIRASSDEMIGDPPELQSIFNVFVSILRTNRQVGDS